MNNVQLINQDSGNFEYYTPPDIVEAAREVMGSIDLDPASSKQANKKIKAGKYYTKDENGLSLPWDANNVWLNHPFSRGLKACRDQCSRETCKERGFCVYKDVPGNVVWIRTLMYEYGHNFLQACCITYAVTSETWFQPLLHYPQCFLSPRTNYFLPDGTIKKGVTKGSVVTYLGENIDKFIEVFDGEFGKVKI